MKITRQQLRKLISEAIKPGSKYDMYKKYNVTGGEQDVIKQLTTDDDPEYREQGRELAKTMGIPLVSTPTIQVIGYQDQFTRYSDQYMYHKVEIPEEIVFNILKTWREAIDKEVIVWKEYWDFDHDAWDEHRNVNAWAQAWEKYWDYVRSDIRAAGLMKLDINWHYDDIRGGHAETLTDSADAWSAFI